MAIHSKAQRQLPETGTTAGDVVHNAGTTHVLVDFVGVLARDRGPVGVLEAVMHFDKLEFFWSYSKTDDQPWNSMSDGVAGHFSTCGGCWMLP